MIPEWLIYAVSFGIVGIIAYVALRFGPVSRSYLRFEKGETARLKEMEATYARMRPRVRPQGRPLYRRRLASHEGLAIFKNGLYAKFSRGAKGRYRFVRFEALTDIYPVTYENPIRSARAARLGLTGWKAIQFETAQGWVFVADSRRHRFDELVPILKQTLGTQWDRLYHADQPLWSNVLTGDAMVHRVIRESRGGEPSPRPGPSLETVAVAPVPLGDRGRLLWEETPQDVEPRVRTFRKATALLLSSAAGLLLLGVLLLTFLPLLVAQIPIALGVTIAALGVVFLIGSRNRTPSRMYEHGFEIPTFSRGSQFVAFADLVGIQEGHNWLDGDYYRLDRAGAEPIAFRRTPGVTAMLPEVRSRMGRPEHRVRVASATMETWRFRRWETGLYAVAVVAGILVTFIVDFTVLRASASAWVWGSLLVFPPVTILLLTAVTAMMQRSWKSRPERLRVFLPTGVVAGLLVLTVATYGVGLGGPSYVVPPPAMQPRPGTTALAAGTYADTVLDIRGPVRVDAGETLVLRNVTVRMDLTADRAFGFWVASGGTLVLEKTTVENVTAPFAYPFEIAGTAQIENSTLSGLWGNASQVNGDGGLEIYSDAASLWNVTIVGARTNGILVIDAAPRILHTTIGGAGDDGVELHHSGALLQNDSFLGCAWAAVLSDGSTAEIRGSLIEGNAHGIAIQASTPVLASNTFRANQNYAIWYDQDSQPVLQGNTFVGNEEDVVAEPASYSVQVCGLASIGLGIVALLALAYVYREELRRPEEPMEPRSP